MAKLPDVESSAEDNFELVEEGDPSLTDEFGMTEEEVEVQARFLVSEIVQAEDASSERYASYNKWRRQVEAKPLAKTRTLNPFRNPSNIMPPLTQIHQQTMSANLVSYLDQSPFWKWTALKDDKECREDATFLTKYFDILATSPSDLNLVPAKRLICDEASLMDKCVVKVPYTVQQWGYKAQDQTNHGLTEAKTMVYHEGPELIAIPAEDFVYPQQWSKIHEMPWVAHIIHLPEHELLSRAEQGLYDVDEVNEILNHGRTSASPKEQQEATLRGDSIDKYTETYDLAEVYFYFDAKNDGSFDDYVWTIDINTGRVLRKQFNDLGMRPFEVVRYIARAHSLGGRAIGQICEGLQDECETIHNLRNDNMKISNMRMLTMSSATKIANGEELFPGKIIINDTDTEVKSIQLGEVYPSSLQAEDKTWQLAAQATGQSEVQRGFGDPTLGQRDTFRGQQMRLASAKGIFGTIADGVKESFSRIGLLVILQLINHKEEVLARERRIQRLTNDELVRLEKMLNLEPSDVPNRFAYTITSVNPDATPGAKMQAIQQFMQLYMGFFQQSTASAVQLFTPQGMMMQQQAPRMYDHFMTFYVGGTKLMQQMLKLTGIEDDPDAFLPDVSVLDFMLDLKSEQNAAMRQQMEATYGAGNRSVGGVDPALPSPAQGGDGAGYPAANPAGSGSSAPAGGGAGAGSFGGQQNGGVGNDSASAY